jgi:hypothetical protein
MLQSYATTRVKDRDIPEPPLRDDEVLDELNRLIAAKQKQLDGAKTRALTVRWTAELKALKARRRELVIAAYTTSRKPT